MATFEIFIAGTGGQWLDAIGINADVMRYSINKYYQANCIYLSWSIYYPLVKPLIIISKDEKVDYCAKPSLDRKPRLYASRRPE